MATANSCSNLVFSLVWLCLMTGGLPPAGDVHNGPSALWHSSCIAPAGIFYSMLTAFLCRMACKCTAFSGLPRHCHDLKLFVKQCLWCDTLKFQQLHHGGTGPCFCSTSTSLIRLLLPPAVPQTLNLWLLDYIKSPLYCIRSLLCWITKPVAHYWTPHKDSEPAGALTSLSFVTFHPFLAWSLGLSLNMHILQLVIFSFKWVLKLLCSFELRMYVPVKQTYN